MKTFLTLAAILLAEVAAAQPVPPEAPSRAVLAETVTVSGMGKATLTPDRYTFTAGVQTVSRNVEEAVRENNTRVANVIAALKRAGATEKEIRTTNFAIWPQQSYAEGKPPTITGYQVTNSVTVTRDKIGDAGNLLQQAVTAGVNTSSGLQFEVSDPTRGRDRGLLDAFVDARAKASVLARAAGRTLGRALTISEGGAVEPPQPMYARMAMKGAVAEQADVPVEPGTQEMTYMLTVVFELR